MARYLEIDEVNLMNASCVAFGGATTNWISLLRTYQLQQPNYSQNRTIAAAIAVKTGKVYFRPTRPMILLGPLLSKGVGDGTL
jgi:hypothetical protein